MRSGVLTILPIACFLISPSWALPAGARPGTQVEIELANVSPEFTAASVAGPLEFPWSIGFLPDGAILVTERPGRLQLIRAGSAMQQIDGVPPLLSDLHAGLLDIAVDPGFAQTGILYLSYSHGTEGASTICVQGQA
jgi:glucose/arabinose dehydrogenase